MDENENEIIRVFNSINVKISFFSLLIDIIGEDEIPLSFNNNLTIRDALIRLVSLIGKNFKDTIFSTKGNLSKYVIIGLNGKDIRTLKGLDTIVNDGDEISFLPAIAGG